MMKRFGRYLYDLPNRYVAAGGCMTAAAYYHSIQLNTVLCDSIPRKKRRPLTILELSSSLEKDSLAFVTQSGKEKLSRLCKSTNSRRIFLLADFDRTVTKYMHNGKPTDMCHGVVHQTPNMPSEFYEETNTLWLRGKSQSHCDWWTLYHANCIKHGIPKDFAKHAVAVSNIGVRDQVRASFEACKAAGIPVLVVSAGITQVIQEVLQGAGVVLSDIEIWANNFLFNADGECIGNGPLIYSGNKDDVPIDQLLPSHFLETSGEVCCVILGDRPHDTETEKAVEAAFYPGKVDVLKVGFFNADNPEWHKLEDFTEVYDVLLFGDRDWDPVMDIISALKSIQSSETF